MQHRILSFITLTAVSVVPAGISASADDHVAANDTELNETLIGLNSPDFATRQAAQERLRTLNENQLTLLASHAETTAAAETAIGCVRALEHHFTGDNPTLAEFAWEALETLNSSERHLVREHVTWVLSSHWQIRMKLATDRLRQHGAAIVLPEGAEAARIVHANRRAEGGKPVLNRPRQGLLFRQPQNVVQVFFTDSWKGDLTALTMLQRVPGLQTRHPQAFANPGIARRGWFGGWNRNVPAPVTIYLITGHSLDRDAKEWIKRAYAERIHERGEVMLGITSDGGGAGEGCVVGSVVPYSSADAARLMAADVITSVADRKITRFEDLVDELRRFSAGDDVDVVVQRIVNQDGRQPIHLPVRLRSWKGYVDAINKAAAQLHVSDPSAIH